MYVHMCAVCLLWCLCVVYIIFFHVLFVCLFVCCVFMMCVLYGVCTAAGVVFFGGL